MKGFWYSIRGEEIKNSEPVEFQTKSLYKTAILAKQNYGLDLIHISFNWALLGDDKRRMLVSAV